MSSVTVAPKVPQAGAIFDPLLFIGCLDGTIHVFRDKETTPLNALTFHMLNGKNDHKFRSNLKSLLEVLFGAFTTFFFIITSLRPSRGPEGASPGDRKLGRHCLHQ